MVLVSQTLVTRTGIQGSFPAGPGVSGIYAYDAGQVQPQLLVHPSPGLGFGLAASDSWLYGCSLMAAPALWRVALPAGGAANDVATTGCFDVAGSATHVFYTVPDLGQIHTLALSGGAPSPIANTSSQPELLALDGTFLYWSYGWSAGSGGIERVPLAGGTPEPVASNELVASRAGLELDATHLYWTTGTGSVRRIAKAGGTAETIAGAPQCADIALGGVFVYCTTGQQLVRFEKAGSGAVEVLASGFPTPLEIVAVSDSALYFTIDGAYVGTQSQEADQVLIIEKPAP